MDIIIVGAVVGMIAVVGACYTASYTAPLLLQYAVGWAANRFWLGILTERHQQAQDEQSQEVHGCTSRLAPTRRSMKVNPALCILGSLVVVSGNSFRTYDDGFFSAARSSQSCIRIGFLGRADIVKLALLMPAARRPGMVAIVGLAARSVQDAIAFKQQHLEYLSNATVYSSYSALLTSPDVDGVYIALPTSLHFEWAALALAAGKHVLLEKPLTSNAVQAEALVALARQRNLVLMHGLHNLHHPMIARVRALVRGLGNLRHAEAKLIMPKRYVQRKGSRYDSALSGGSAMDLAGYVLSTLLEILYDDGYEKGCDVRSTVATRWPKDPLIDEGMEGDILIGGLSVRFAWSLIGAKTSETKELRVVGSNGTLVVTGFQAPQFGNSITLHALDGTVVHRQSFDKAITSYGNQLSHFTAAVKRIRSGAVSDAASFVNTGAASVRLMRCIDAVYTSAGMQPRTGLIERPPERACATIARGAPVHTTAACDQAEASLLGSAGNEGAKSGINFATALTVLTPVSTDGGAQLRAVLYTSGAAIVKHAMSAAQLQRIFAAIEKHGRWRLPPLDTRSGVENQPRRLKAVLSSSTGSSSLSPPELLSSVFEPIYALAEAALSGVVDSGAILKLARRRLHRGGDTNSDSILEEVHLNSALSGSKYQNPHYDQAYNDPQLLLTIDIPLAEVTDELGPLEVWPGTQGIPLEQLFSRPTINALRSAGGGSLQYSACWCEVNHVLGRNFPSVRLLSGIGDAVVRFPSTWHRGTPNRHPSQVRDMVTFVWRLARPAAVPVWLLTPPSLPHGRSLKLAAWPHGPSVPHGSVTSRPSPQLLAGWRVTEAEWSAAQEKVAHILRDVPLKHRERCERVLRNLPDAGFAQAWQDHFLYRNFFAGMVAESQKGLYIDIGTNDAIKISNTAFFDICLGWTGVCFEPQANYHERIRSERSCHLVPSCVMGRPTKMIATGSGGLLTLRPSTVVKGGGSEMQCVGLRESLVKLKLETRRVDLISIDIEGNEPSVLKCLPWGKLDVRAVLIETNKYRDLRPVDMFFSAHGYVNAKTFLYKAYKDLSGSWLDNLYVKMPGGAPLVQPPGKPRCDRADLEFNPDCDQWREWARPDVSDGWGACCRRVGCKRLMPNPCSSSTCRRRLVSLTK